LEYKKLKKSFIPLTEGAIRKSTTTLFVASLGYDIMSLRDIPRR
jgi:hypothetical protein